MSLLPTPDLRSNRRLMGTALVVVLCVWALLALGHGDVMRSLGDTDDAMRLVRVRDLLAGQGWFDQRIARLQPPLGSMMHWSRLLDGALAAMDWSFARAVSPTTAEWLTRFVWPLLWVIPGVACVLSITRGLAPERVAGRAAMMVAAVLMLIDVQAYVQFRPGRVDHHNIQIVMALIAAAGAISGGTRARAGAIAGAATGIGLAIGVEALAFHAIIGAYFGLRAAIDAKQAAVARAYAVALAISSTGLFLLQTPPAIWFSPVCDAIGWNLVLAIILACLGLAAMATWADRLSLTARLACLSVVGVVATAGYLALDPACIHGPFAAVDPRLKPFWFNLIQELRSWPQMWVLDRDAALTSIVMVVTGVGASLVVMIRRRGDPVSLLAAALVVVAGVAAANALRMSDYAFWFGMPLIAVAIGLLVERRFHGTLVSALALGLFLAPQTVARAASGLADLAAAPTKTKPAGEDEGCLRNGDYSQLAALPPGVVLAPIDLGPFILANTRDSVLAAPYHRMTWGILAAHDAFSAPSKSAQSAVRGLNVRYVIDCPSDLSPIQPTGLADDLRRGRVPAWLRRLPARGGALRIYQVEAAAPDHH